MACQPENACQLAEAGWGCSRLEAALSWIWRWRGVVVVELAGASGSCFTQHRTARVCELECVLADDVAVDLQEAARR